MSRVVINNLHKHFAGRAPGAIAPKRGAIDGLDLEIRDGEFFVLLGPSGCGKTTTLRCIAGLEEPTGGSIVIGDQKVSDARNGLFVQPDRRGLGMMFQSYALWPHMTVAENVAYPLKRRRAEFDRARIAKEVSRNLGLVGLEGLEARYPSELSGGQQQRVALARAIAAQPRLLLFDEPLSNLDAQLRATLRVELRRIHQETGATSIYVTHDQSEALALADRIAVLRNGRVEQIGAPDEVFLSPATPFVAAFVGYENLLPGALVAPDRFRVEGWDHDVGVRPTSRLSGASGQAAVRSSDVRISINNDHKTSTGIQGFLEDVTYFGDRQTAVVRVGERRVYGTLPISSWPLSRKANREVVSLSFASEGVLALPPEPHVSTELASVA